MSPRMVLFATLATAALAHAAPGDAAPAAPPAESASPARASAPGGDSGSAAGPLTVEDLVRLKRLSDPQISPDARYVAYVQRDTDMDANQARTDIWLLDLRDPAARPRQLTRNPANDSSPRWAPDSRTLYFLSSRSGTSQVWRLSLDGGESMQVTAYPLEVGSLKVSPRGDRLALSMQIMTDCATLACTRERLDAHGRGKATGRVYDKVFIRHWDTWFDGTRSHLFTAAIGADGKAAQPVDVSRSLDADVPSKPFGGDEDYAFSPDGTLLAFSARIAGRSEPWSTNFDVFEVAASGSAAPQNLTASNPAWDAQPVYLRNGSLAWLAQERPGFESDRFHVVLRDARSGAIRPLTQGWDHSIVRLGVTPDGRRLLATADELGQVALFAIDPDTGAPRKLVDTGAVDDYAAGNDFVVFGWASLGAPTDLFRVGLGGGAPRRLTRANGDVLDARRLSEFEQYSFKGWNNETVYGYVMKPFGYHSGGRYPLAFVVHGGPQSSMQNIWSYRWNAATLAGHGYAVVMIDFHGSPGYGQAFTDSISGDWGGKPLVDLQKGLQAALDRFPWIDGARVCALGASYGGFMMNWIQGNWPDRFQCIVNHDGVFDQRMMYYSTEELWFMEWENHGTQYEHPQNYEQFNPADFVIRWHTPMLVVHGEQDFRIPYSQGIGAFTALQRRGVQSQLLVFPDENHWVLKPANSVLWYHTVLDWLDAHLKN